MVRAARVWYISLLSLPPLPPSMHDKDVEFIYATLFWGRKHNTTNFFFYFQTWMRSSRMQLQLNSHYICHFEVSSNIRGNSLKKSEFILIVIFSLPSLLLLLKRPIFINVTLPFYALVLLSSTLNSCSAIWWIRSLYMHNQKHKKIFSRWSFDNPCHYFFPFLTSFPRGSESQDFCLLGDGISASEYMRI